MTPGRSAKSSWVNIDVTKIGVGNKRLHDELLAIFRGEKFAAFASQNFLDQAAGSTEAFSIFLKKDRQDAAILVDRWMKGRVPRKSRPQVPS